MHILFSLYCNAFAYIEEKRWKLCVHPNWKHLSTLDSKPFCLGRLPPWYWSLRSLVGYVVHNLCCDVYTMQIKKNTMQMKNENTKDNYTIQVLKTVSRNEILTKQIRNCTTQTIMYTLSQKSCTIQNALHWKWASSTQIKKYNTNTKLCWCIHLSISLYSYFNYLVSVTAGGPRSPRGHM